MSCYYAIAWFPIVELRAPLVRQTHPHNLPRFAVDLSGQIPQLVERKGTHYQWSASGYQKVKLKTDKDPYLLILVHAYFELASEVKDLFGELLLLCDTFINQAVRCNTFYRIARVWYVIAEFTVISLKSIPSCLHRFGLESYGVLPQH